MNTEVKQGDMYTVDTTNADQSHYVMQGAHDRYIGRMDVFAVNGDTATVHCRIEYFDDRDPKGTSNVVDRIFDTPIAMIPGVGGHKWINQESK